LRRRAATPPAAAIALGPAALTYGGIVVGMVEHDRALAQDAFEIALAISPSASWAHLWGLPGSDG
jgi:hypothetical protein